MCKMNLHIQGTNASIYTLDWCCMIGVVEIVEWKTVKMNCVVLHVNTFSHSGPLWGGPLVAGGFPQQRTTYVVFCIFLLCWIKRAFEQTHIVVLIRCQAMVWIKLTEWLNLYWFSQIYYNNTFLPLSLEMDLNNLMGIWFPVSQLYKCR